MPSTIHVTKDANSNTATFSVLTVDELALLVNEISQATEPSDEPTSITSGASPINADPEVLYYEITTGGTAGQEIINLPKFDLDANSQNVSRIGQTVVFYTKTLTDPADVPVIKVANAAPFAYGRATHSTDNLLVASPGVIMDYEGACAIFRWVGDTFQLDYAASNGNDDSTFDTGQHAFWQNDVLFSGAVKMNALPTADPHIAGNLWNSSGTLKISAG